MSRTAPEPPAVRPGRGVRLTDAQKHAWHHYRIALSYRDWEKHPNRTGADKVGRREAAKHAWWALKAHMAGMHGRHSAGHTIGITYDELAERHTRLHHHVVDDDE